MKYSIMHKRFLSQINTQKIHNLGFKKCFSKFISVDEQKKNKQKL